MNWSKAKLKDVIEIKHGWAFKGKYFSIEPTDDIVLTPGNFKIGGGFKSDKLKYYKGEYPHDYILNENDIVITMTDLSVNGDTLGYSAKIPNDMGKRYLLNQRIGLVTVKSDLINPDFIYWLMRTPNYQRIIANSGRGATVKHTSPTLVKEYTFSYPSYSMQCKIAGILSAYDDLIENNLKRIKLLEEAVNLKYTILVTNESAFKDYMIEDVCDTFGGGTPSTSNRAYWDDGDILWFSPTDLTKHNSLVLLDSGTKITRLGLEKSSAKIVPPKSILMTSRATIGYFGLINKPVCTNQGFINIVPFEEYYRAYMLFNLMSRKEEIINHANGSTYLEITKGVFRKMKIKIPQNKERLIAFEKDFEVTFALIENLLIQIKILQEARDILLPRLMNGEIEI